MPGDHNSLRPRFFQDSAAIFLRTVMDIPDAFALDPLSPSLMRSPTAAAAATALAADSQPFTVRPTPHVRNPTLESAWRQAGGDADVDAAAASRSAAAAAEEEMIRQAVLASMLTASAAQTHAIKVSRASSSAPRGASATHAGAGASAPALARTQSGRSNPVPPLPEPHTATFDYSPATSSTPVSAATSDAGGATLALPLRTPTAAPCSLHSLDIDAAHMRIEPSRLMQPLHAGASDETASEPGSERVLSDAEMEAAFTAAMNRGSAGIDRTSSTDSGLIRVVEQEEAAAAHALATGQDASPALRRVLSLLGNEEATLPPHASETTAAQAVMLDPGSVLTRRDDSPRFEGGPQRMHHSLDSAHEVQSSLPSPSSCVAPIGDARLVSVSMDGFESDDASEMEDATAASPT
ncbi:hypothetical protein EON68_03385, partial [archaeon]